MINCYAFDSFGGLLIETSFPFLFLSHIIVPSYSFALAFAAAVVRCDGGNGDGGGGEIVKSCSRLQIAVYYHQERTINNLFTIHQANFELSGEGKKGGSLKM